MAKSSLKLPSGPDLTAEIERVDKALADRKVGAKGRLELLRRQASLGDLRDAIAQRARRAAR